ncbi:unnamed protein product, partial [marine sediment metagenome]
EDKPINTIPAMLVQAADAISASRPGARREVLEKYLERVKKMEEIACSFEGVSKAYAIWAGRELRVMVEPKDINDKEAEELSLEIITEIEKKKKDKELSYPGQIKVTVIREIRSVGYTK